MSKLQLLLVAIGFVAAVCGSPLRPIVDPFINTGTGNRPRATDACKQPMTKGPCEEKIPRYFYNAQTSMCEPFNYGGCWGNDNNFLTPELCQKTCMSDDLDVLPPPPSDSLFKLFP